MTEAEHVLCFVRAPRFGSNVLLHSLDDVVPEELPAFVKKMPSGLQIVSRAIECERNYVANFRIGRSSDDTCVAVSDEARTRRL